jgi:hypothetical protein
MEAFVEIILVVGFLLLFGFGAIVIGLRLAKKSSASSDSFSKREKWYFLAAVIVLLAIWLFTTPGRF